MHHQDLGALEGPVLLFGGPYSNAQALSALRLRAEAFGVAPSHMICTGDVVAYAGDPADVVAQMQALACPVLAGNCELQLADGAADCGCGFEEGSACDLLSVQWFNYALQSIDTEQKKWMSDLPDVLSFTHAGARYGVLHGGVADVARFIWSTSDAAVFEAEWDALEQVIGTVDHVIAGHSGIAFQRETPRGRWINAGVIGMPPHDGAADTRFALLNAGEITFHLLHYDAKAAAARMGAVGLPPEYARSLVSGYWPSEDILPADLRVPLSARG